MDISAIDLNLMTAFEAIFMEKSISKAARRIGLSQPALSAALARLRRVYGDPLFVRAPRGMTPTVRATRLAGPIAKALTLLRESLIQETPFDPSVCRKGFRLAMSDWLCLKLLPVVEGRLRKQAPGIDLAIFNLAQKEMYRALQEGGLDLGISGQPNLGTAAYRQILYREHYECLVWSGHPDIHDKLTLKDYVRFPHILFSPQGSGPGAVDQVLAQKGLKRRIALRVVYSLAIPSLIRGTDFIATVPAPLARTFVATFDLKIHPPPIRLPEHDMTQYWNREAHSDPAHRWLRGVLKQICGGFP